MPILLGIGNAYPALQLTLTFTDQVIDLVEEGVDLAIRFSTLEESGHLVAPADGAPLGHLRHADLPADLRHAAKPGRHRPLPLHRRLPARAAAGLAHQPVRSANRLTLASMRSNCCMINFSGSGMGDVVRLDF